MKVQLIDTHLAPRSRSSPKIKVKYQGHVSQEMGVLGALVFHKQILFICLMSSENKVEASNTTEKLDENRKAKVSRIIPNIYFTKVKTLLIYSGSKNSYYFIV